MDDLVSLELALAALYQACSERFPDTKGFWLAIQHQEEAHAQSIRGLAGLISAHPEEFRSGRPFGSAAIRTIVSSVAGYTEQVRNRQLSRRRALIIARDIENSVLEAKYGEIVATDNVEFAGTIRRLAEDTLAHRNLFAAEVAKLPA